MGEISKVVLPDESSYDIISKRTRGIYRGSVDSTSTNTAFTATIPGITELYDGLTIMLKNTKVASAAGCTLNVNGLGAHPLWVSNRNAAVTTHWGLNTEWMFIYDGTNQHWVMYEGYYVANSNTIGEYAGACTAGSGGMARYSLTMQTANDAWESIVTSSTTAASKHKSSKGFLITSPILYQSGGTYTSGNKTGQASCWTTVSFDTRYSFNVNSTWSAAGRPLYLVGTIEDGKFYLKDDEWWADEIPENDLTYFYWYVGQMYDAYRATLYPYHPIYYYREGELHRYIPGINDQYSRWVDKKMVMFGDSIVYGGHDDPPPFYDPNSTYKVGDRVLYGAQEGDEQKYECIVAITTPEAWNSAHWTETSTRHYQGYVLRLRKMLGLKNAVNRGISGSTMTNGVRSDKASINETIHSISASTFSSYSLAIIAGGINDFRQNAPLGTLGLMGDTNINTNTFYGALRDAIEYLISCNPNMHICLMTPLQCDNKGKDVNYVNAAGLKIIDYVNAIKDVGTMYSIQVIDLYSCSGLNAKNLSALTEDGLHPNGAGYDFITPVIAQHLNSGASEGQATVYERLSDRIYSLEVNQAGPYRNTITYEAGAYVRNLDDGLLYQANTDITTPENWNANHWTQTRESIEFRRLHHLIANDYDATKTYSVGDYIMRASFLYKCNTAITTPEAWNSAHWTQVHLTEHIGEAAELNYVHETDQVIQLKSHDGLTDLFTRPGIIRGDNVVVGTDSATIASGSITNKGTFALTRGWYYITVSVTWQGNANGYRQIGVAPNATIQYTTDKRDQIVRSAPTGSSTMFQQLCFPLTVGANSVTNYINLYQNSGSALTAVTRVSYIGIKG